MTAHRLPLEPPWLNRARSPRLIWRLLARTGRSRDASELGVAWPLLLRAYKPGPIVGYSLGLFTLAAVALIFTTLDVTQNQAQASLRLTMPTFLACALLGPVASFGYLIGVSRAARRMAREAMPNGLSALPRDAVRWDAALRRAWLLFAALQFYIVMLGRLAGYQFVAATFGPARMMEVDHLITALSSPWFIACVAIEAIDILLLARAALYSLASGVLSSIALVACYVAIFFGTVWLAELLELPAWELPQEATEAYVASIISMPMVYLAGSWFRRRFLRIANA